MRILISNDDGYFAPGIAVLAEVAAQFGEVTVVAPEQDRSGASNSLTLDRPLTLRRVSNGFYYVNGTPTDCVHLAVTGMFDYQPDLVLSGINRGANMGDDTIYSGTVAAATEGHLLGIPAIAFSLASKDARYLQTTARDVATKIITWVCAVEPRPSWLLNVNIPDVRQPELRGLQVTRLGRRHRAEPVIQQTNPRGETIYWVGGAGAAADAGEGTDFYAIDNSYVAITPLQIDLTQYADLEQVRKLAASCGITA